MDGVGDDRRTESHEALIQRAIELGREVAAAGDTPFGTPLVRDGEDLDESGDATVTDGDVAIHPELKLVRWTAREPDPDERRETTYTGTEPCPMYGGVTYDAGLRRVIYGTAAETLDEIRGSNLVSPCTAVFDRVTERVDVVGTILPGAGRALHESLWRDADEPSSGDR